MQISVSSTLTVYHDGQFWVGLAEHVEDGRYGAARIVFGAEPSDRCAGQDAEAGRPPIGMRVRMLQRDSSCRIRLLCGCRKTCWQHSYYPNDVRIPWDRFA